MREATPPTVVAKLLAKDEFTAHTGIEVDIEIVPLEQVLQKVTADSQGKLGAYDLYYMDQSWTSLFAGDTNVGMKREHNEDSFYLPKAERLAIVADGMGGHASGEVAKAEARVAAREADVARLRAEQQAKLDKWNGQWVKYRERPTHHRPPWGPVPKPVDEALRVRNAERALTRARDNAERKTQRAHELTAPRSGSTDLVGVGTGSPEPAEDDSKTLVTRGTRGPVGNLTDPDSRLMSSKRGWVQGYNAQFAVTADQLVLAVQITQDPVDNPWFIPMTHLAVAAATDLAAARHPDTDPGEHGGIGVILADAGYNSDANLTAPGPDRLIALGKSRAHHRAAREDPAHGDPPPEATAREAMDHRLRTPEGHATYQRRGATVEPGIGNIKKIVPTLTRRGLAAATSEIWSVPAFVDS